jgi:hypothetical protein
MNRVAAHSIRRSVFALAGSDWQAQKSCTSLSSAGVKDNARSALSARSSGLVPGCFLSLGHVCGSTRNSQPLAVPKASSSILDHTACDSRAGSFLPHTQASGNCSRAVSASMMSRMLDKSTTVGLARRKNERRRPGGRSSSIAATNCFTTVAQHRQCGLGDHPNDSRPRFRRDSHS